MSCDHEGSWSTRIFGVRRNTGDEQPLREEQLTRLFSVVLCVGLAVVACQSPAAPPPKRPRARVETRPSPRPTGLQQARRQYARVHKALAAAVKKGGSSQVKNVLAGLPVKVPLECRGVLHSSLGLHRVPVGAKGLAGARLYPGSIVAVGLETLDGEEVSSSGPSGELVSLCAFNIGRKSTRGPFVVLVSVLEWDPTLGKGVTVTTRWKHFPKGSAVFTVKVEQKPTKGRTIGDKSSGPYATTSSAATLYSYVEGRFHILTDDQSESVKPIRGDGYEKATVSFKFLSVGRPQKHIAIRIERVDTHKPPLPGTPSSDSRVVDSWDEDYILDIYSPVQDGLKMASEKARKTLLKLPALAPYRKDKASGD